MAAAGTVCPQIVPSQVAELDRALLPRVTMCRSCPAWAAKQYRRRRLSSNDLAADPCRNEFGNHDHYEDDEQHQARLIPIEISQRSIERHADPAAADQAEHCGFAHVDVPTKYRDGEERGLDLRPIAFE